MASPNESTVPIWSRPPVLAAFVAVVVLIRLYVSGATELVRDEAYYALWSTVPSAGYLDHPPMIAWLIAAGRALLGETAIAVRLFPALSAAAIAFAIYRAGLVLFDRRVGALAAIWFVLTPANALLFLATPDAPVVTFWALSIWAVAEFVARRNANWWLAAGFFAGLALASKYTAFALGAGLLLYLLTNRERRRWLKFWQVWAGGALALVILAPNLWWNIERGWASFAFQGKRLTGYGTTTGSALSDFGELVAGQALALGLMLFVFALAGMFLFFRRSAFPGSANLALPVLTALPMLLWFLGYVLQFRVEANWLLPIWPMLSLAGAWAAVHLRPRHGLLRGLFAAMRWLQAPVTAVLVALLYAQALWEVLPLQPGVDRTRDLHGWAHLRAEVAGYAETSGARWTAVGVDDYGLTGELAVRFEPAGPALPVRAVDMPERYAFLPALDRDLLAAPALYVQSTMTSASPPQQFENAELLGEARRMEGENVLETFQVYRVSRPTAELAAALARDGASE